MHTVFTIKVPWVDARENPMSSKEGCSELMTKRTNSLHVLG